MDNDQERQGEAEQGSGPAPQPPSSMPYLAGPGRVPPEYSAFLFRQRLLALRYKTLKMHGTLALAMTVMLSVILYSILSQILQFIIQLLIMPLLMFNQPGNTAMTAPGGGYSQDMSFFVLLLSMLGWIVALVLVVIIGRMMYHPMLRWVQNMHASRYAEAARYVHHTDLLRIVAEENFTQIIIEAVNELPSLRWISPGRPKSLEQQLEFSACYWQSIIELSYGPGRLSNSSLISGSWSWQNSRVSPFVCCGCCCLTGSMAVLVLPFTIITFNHHLLRVARICCLIDYLTEDRFAT